MTLPPHADPPAREAAIRNARDALALGPLIVDTETTGLGDDAEIVEIAVVDSQGSIVFDSLVKPRRPIPREASDIHGITNAAVEDAPGFAQLWAAELKGVLRTAPHWHVIAAPLTDSDFRHRQLSSLNRKSRVSQALKRREGVQPVQGGGTSERPQLPVEEDCMAARDIPDARPSGSNTNANAGGKGNAGHLVEETAVLASWHRLD